MDLRALYLAAMLHQVMTMRTFRSEQTMRNYKHSDSEYNDWFIRGYDSYTLGHPAMTSMTVEQRVAWLAGYDQAKIDRDEDDERS